MVETQIRILPGHKRRKTELTIKDDAGGRTVSFRRANYIRNKDEVITGNRKQVMIDKNAYLRNEARRRRAPTKRILGMPVKSGMWRI